MPTPSFFSFRKQRIALAVGSAAVLAVGSFATLASAQMPGSHDLLHSRIQLCVHNFRMGQGGSLSTCVHTAINAFWHGGSSSSFLSSAHSSSTSAQSSSHSSVSSQSSLSSTSHSSSSVSMSSMPSQSSMSMSFSSLSLPSSPGSMSSSSSTSKSSSSMSSVASSASSMATANVSITANGAFSPQSLTVKKGTTVKWTNNSQTLQTVTTPNTFSPLNSTALMPGNTYSYTFTQVGTFPYVSLANPSMTGMVIVQQ